jgi:hypothetical protein
MSPVGAAYRQIAAVVAMAQNRDGWERALDRSLDGVFFSFAALIYAAPVSLLGAFVSPIAATRLGSAPIDPLAGASVAFRFAAEFAGFALDWALGLVALLALARIIGATRRAGDIVIGYNWLAPITAVLQVAPIALFAATGGKTAFALLGPAGLALSIALYWGVLRRALATTIGATMAALVTLILVGLITRGAVGAVAIALYKAAS